MDFVMPDLASADTWMALVTLTFLEIVLGIDNIIFISIAAGKLPPEQQGRASRIGLLLAMGLRLLLLFGISVLVAMSEPWIRFSNGLFSAAFTGQSLILIAGGLFLLYKSTVEIHHKLEGGGAVAGSGRATASLGQAILQITVINVVFSFDSILTAVGMTNGLTGALPIMILSIVLSVVIMMVFAAPVGRFVNQHPTIQMLGLAFLILIGFMLIAEGAHLGHLMVGSAEVGTVPKGYLYFAITFSLFVEFLNMRLRRRKDPVQLHDAVEAAKQEGVWEGKS